MEWEEEKRKRTREPPRPEMIKHLLHTRTLLGLAPSFEQEADFHALDLFELGRERAEHFVGDLFERSEGSASAEERGEREGGETHVLHRQRLDDMLKRPLLQLIQPNLIGEPIDGFGTTWAYISAPLTLSTSGERRIGEQVSPARVV